MSKNPSTTEQRERAQRLLCLRCQRGDRLAWEELVAIWERPLYYYVRRLTRSDADALQVLQDAWLQVFSSLPSLGDPARLAPWLYTLTRRSVLRYISTLGDDRLRLVDTSEQQDWAHATDDEWEASHDNAQAVHRGLEELAPLLREVLVLFYLEDLSLQGIAEVLDVPAGTVKSRLHRARKELRSVLEREE